MPSFFTWVLEIWTYCLYPLNHFPSPWLLLGFQMSGTLSLPSLRVNTALTEWCFPICKDLISLLLWGRWLFFLCFRYLQQRFWKSWDVLTTKSRTRTHTESFHFKLIAFSKIFYHSALVFCFFKSQEWVTALTGHSFLVFLWLFYLNMDGHLHFKSVFLVYWS